MEAKFLDIHRHYKSKPSRLQTDLLAMICPEFQQNQLVL